MRKNLSSKKILLKTFVVCGLFLMIFSQQGWGKETSSLLSFKQWKLQQISSAQNQYARLYNRTKVNGEAATEKLHQQLLKAKKSVEISRSFGVEEYVEVYLKQQSLNDQKILQFVKQSDPEEMSQILKYLLMRSIKERKEEVGNHLSLEKRISSTPLQPFSIKNSSYLRHLVPATQMRTGVFFRK
ncbi:MAG: hypothetical protein D6797_04090 [Bdellovibrio sp.]|nr:MAG: hypothetical protein D6797_04090 [Bdellovibrio sp.]